MRAKKLEASGRDNKPSRNREGNVQKGMGIKVYKEEVWIRLVNSRVKKDSPVFRPALSGISSGSADQLRKFCPIRLQLCPPSHFRTRGDRAEINDDIVDDRLI